MSLIFRLLWVFIFLLFAPAANAGVLDSLTGWLSSKIDSVIKWFSDKIDSIIKWIKDLTDSFFKAISDAINAVWVSFVAFIKSCLLTLGDLLKYLFYFIFDQLLNLLGAILAGLGNLFSGLANFSVSAFPESVQNMLGLIGFDQCMSIIITALSVRFFLQLIPFTRLGS